MPYLDKPDAADRLSTSQADIQGNFQEIRTLLTVNHADFGAGQGKHSHVTLPDQAADPATLVNEVAVYAKSVGGASALFLRNENNGTVVDFTTATLGATGTCTLPCGLIMKWGTGTIAVGQQNSVATAFAAAFPTALYSVQLTPYTAQTGAAEDYVFNVFNQTVAGFTVNRNHGYTGTIARFYYMAIGD